MWGGVVSRCECQCATVVAMGELVGGHFGDAGCVHGFETGIKLVCAHGFEELFKKSFVRTT